MAKGKNSPALFEVIDRNNKSNGSSGPRTQPRIHGGPVSWLRGAASGKPYVPAPAAPAIAAAPVAPKVKVEVDPDRQVVKFNASYTALIVATFAVAVVVGMAYLVGRQASAPVEVAAKDAGAAGIATTEQLRQQPPQAGVLDVTQAAPLMATTPAPGTAPRQAPAVTPPPPITHAPVAAAMPTGPRIVGQNYVIVQSYPEKEQAEEARDLLLKAGIPCTVERGPQGWVPMTWYSVVGTHGFDRARGPEYERYIKSIETVSAKAAEKSKFKKFDPRAYRWR